MSNKNIFSHVNFKQEHFVAHVNITNEPFPHIEMSNKNAYLPCECLIRRFSGFQLDRAWGQIKATAQGTGYAFLHVSIKQKYK